MDLSKKIKEIRKFSQFGLVKFSQHCHQRCNERNITQNEIMSMLCDNHNSIVQSHEKYKNNRNPTYVIWTKSKKTKKYYHIVVEDAVSELGAHVYTIQTVYEPSEKFFEGNGRFVKPKKERGLLNSHY